VAVGDREVSVTPSIGVALASGQQSPEDLLRDADATMYRAKQRGGGRFEMFDTATRVSAMERLELEHDLRRAIERRELQLYYQPEVSIADRRVKAVEALLRWEHPERGLLMPADFIPVAEETGLILPLGAWVVVEACRQAKSWQRAMDLPNLVMSVNVSVRQLAQQDLSVTVGQALQESGLSASSLCLELTESAVMEDAERSLQVMRRLHKMGIQLAIDDFGTGFSSLSYLRRFPIMTVLKIDRSFVQGLGEADEDAVMVKAAVGLARGLGMSVVAEGVETERQLGELGRLGCDMAQGYYFARPQPAGVVARLLKGTLPN
jgi:EAL domain-containing protein (putative c-di-GMP-specific phosphodiesterase class I)